MSEKIIPEKLRQELREIFQQTGKAVTALESFAESTGRLIEVPRADIGHGKNAAQMAAELARNLLQMS